MPRRNYDQYCSLARSLDVVGERWTLLIIRDLLLGPKRFVDLLDGLPGIGRNLLTDRLAHLRDAGLVERATLPPPAGSRVYELTDLGVQLRPVILELSRWGLHFLNAPRPGDRMHPAWLMNTMLGSFRPESARGVTETYEFRIDEDVFHVRVEDGEIDVLQGSAPAPDFTFEADLATFIAVGARQLEPGQAVATGRARFAGDPEAGLRSIAILSPHLGALRGSDGLRSVLLASFRSERARGVHETYEFHIEGESFHALVDDGEIAVEPGPADDPVFAISTDLGTLLGLGVGENDLDQDIASGRVHLEGDQDAARRAAELFAPARPLSNGPAESPGAAGNAAALRS